MDHLCMDALMYPQINGGKMKQFLTKTHLLKEISRIASQSQLREFASAVSDDDLNEYEIITNGSDERIFQTLKNAPKAVLEDHFHQLFSEQDEDSDELYEEIDDEDADAEDQDQDEEDSEDD